MLFKFLCTLCTLVSSSSSLDHHTITNPMATNDTVQISVNTYDIVTHDLCEPIFRTKNMRLWLNICFSKAHHRKSRMMFKLAILQEVLWHVQSVVALKIYFCGFAWKQHGCAIKLGVASFNITSNQFSNG